MFTNGHGIPPGSAWAFWILAAPQLAVLALVVVLIGLRLLE